MRILGDRIASLCVTIAERNEWVQGMVGVVLGHEEQGIGEHHLYNHHMCMKNISIQHLTHNTHRLGYRMLLIVSGSSIHAGARQKTR